MASIDTTRAEGLRERKKVQTRTAISDAARELFDQQGFAATTIPQIAERAQVSPRTVSYYFPVKEQLVFPDQDELLGALESALSDREEGETSGDTLLRWLMTFADRSAEDEARDRSRRCIVEDDPGLRAYELELESRAEAIIAASFAEDLSLPVDHHVPRMIASATLGALHSLADEDGQKPDSDRAKVLIEDVMAFITAGAREFATD